MDKVVVVGMRTENAAWQEQMVMKKEQAYIRRQLGVEDEEEVEVDGVDSAVEAEVSSDEAEHSGRRAERTVSVMSDGGYGSAEDERVQEKICKSVSFVVDLENSGIPEDIESYLRSLPAELQRLLQGLDQGIPDEYAVPDKKPEWLDPKKYKIGQAFAQKFYFGLNYAEMLALIMLFSFPGGLQPLIFTGKSGTPFTAFKRYLSTVLRVKSWFEHDVWSEGTLGYRNIKAVRAMHLNVSKRLNSIPMEDLKPRLTLENGPATWSPLKDKIREDFEATCPFLGFRPVDELPNKVFVNQLDMSITQFGFVGFMVLYPEKFGAASATEEEIDGFVHLWRCLGYLLGIQDEFNFCSGTLDEVRGRSQQVVEHWAKPSLRHVSEDWEHMSRCLTEGISYYVPGLTFEVSLLYLCWVIDIPAPRVYATLSWTQYCMLQLMKFTLTVTMRLPGMFPVHNWLLRRSLARAQSFSPEHLKRLENRTYDYERHFDTRL